MRMQWSFPHLHNPPPALGRGEEGEEGGVSTVSGACFARGIDTEVWDDSFIRISRRIPPSQNARLSRRLMGKVFLPPPLLFLRLQTY